MMISAVETMFSTFYAAAAGRVPWKQPLDGVARFFGLWAAQMVGVDKRNGGLMFSAEGGPVLPQAALDYIRHYHTSNPRLAPALATPAGEWMHCHENFDDAYVATSPFYQEFLIPHGGRYLSAVKLIDDEDVIFMLGLMRGSGSQPLGPMELPTMVLLHHHARQALQDFLHLRTAFAELGVAREILAPFGRAMLLIDETRRIQFRNDAAQELLSDTSSIFLDRGGFFACADARDNDALTNALHGLELGNPSGAGTRRRAVRLSDRRTILFVSAVEPGPSMRAFGPHPVALVIVHRPGDARHVADAFLISEAFDLTPAEARVTAGLVGGANVDEIARRCGTTAHTVRSQIRRAMEKAGVNRRIDLMRKVMDLA